MKEKYKLIKSILLVAGVLGMLLFVHAGALADSQLSRTVVRGLDTVWVLFAAVLVFFMLTSLQKTFSTSAWPRLAFSCLVMQSCLDRGTDLSDSRGGS